MLSAFSVPNLTNNMMGNTMHPQLPMTTSMFTQTTAQQTQPPVQQTQQFTPMQSQSISPTTLQKSIYNVKPVTSFEEARASSIDFDGKINIFTDFNNGYIYIKSINMTDGNANLQVYKLQPTNNVMQQQYITNQDLENLYNRMVNFEQGLNNLQQDFNKIQTEWGTVSNDKSINNGSTKQKSNGILK